MNCSRLRSSNASQRILRRLQFPATREELAKAAYPETEYDYCGSRVQEHIECFNSILSREKQFILRKEGKRALRRLIKDVWHYEKVLRKMELPEKATMLMPVGDDAYRPVEVKLNREEYLKQYPYRLYGEIDDALERFDSKGFDKKEEERIKAQLCNVSGKNISAYIDSFLTEWKAVYRRWSVRSKNKCVYQIDRKKLFRLFVKSAEMPRQIENTINTEEFREFLVGWLVKGISGKKFTRRTAMYVVKGHLRNYKYDYEMSHFLFKRFGIKTKLKAELEKHVRFGWHNVPKNMDTVALWFSGSGA